MKNPKAAFKTEHRVKGNFNNRNETVLDLLYSHNSLKIIFNQIPA